MLATAAILLLSSPFSAEEIAFCPHTVTSDAANTSSMVVADLDGDSDTDILAGHQTGIFWHENDGATSPTFTPHRIVFNATGSENVLAADLDGDTDLDVLSVRFAEWRIDWYENNGMTPPVFLHREVTSSTEQPFSISAADLNGDHRIDFVVALHDIDTITWYRNDGGSPPIFSPQLLTSTAPGVNVVHAENLDGDGDVDVISANWNTASLVWYRNDGNSTPSFSLHTIASDVGGVRFLATADINSDGHEDILTASTTRGEVVWYRNDGASPPSFTGTVIDTSASFRSFQPSDIDGDEDTDLISASDVGAQINWYENDGNSSPSFLTHAASRQNIGFGDCGSADGVRFVAGADINGDGATDVLGAPADNGRLFWYENTSPAGPFGAGSPPPLFSESEQISVILTPSGDIKIDWGASCMATDTGYEIYEGMIGNFTSHAPRVCSTGDETEITFPVPVGSKYFFVAARNESAEGSYGLRSDGTERAVGVSACLPKNAACSCTCE